MSIASEITRLQGVKSDILTAIADKGVTVPADSMLDDCPALIASIPAGGGATYPNLYKEQIKDNEYTIVQIGNKFYTVEPLREHFTTVQEIYNPDFPYSLDVPTNECVGRYYNALAVEEVQSWLQSNNSDWRVATKQDFEDLKTFNRGDLKAPIYWANANGITNKTFFSALPSGYMNGTTLQQYGTHSLFITKSVDDGKYYYLNIPTNNDTPPLVQNIYFSNTNSWPIRLVKDVV